MQFISEAERLKHPHAQKIPSNLWFEVFNQRLSVNSPFFFDTPLDTLLHESFTLNAYEASCAAVILLIRFSNTPDKRILSLFARLTVSEVKLRQYAATCGFLHWLSLFYPEEQQAQTRVLEADDSTVFCLAAENGHLDILKWLAEKTPSLLDEMIKADNYGAFCLAALNGHLDILKWLAEKMPDHLEAMIKADDYQPFRLAADNGHLDILEWLAAVQPQLLEEMIQADNFYAFRLAAENSRLNILNWLATMHQQLLEEMIQLDDYHAFYLAASRGDAAVASWLLEQSVDCFAYAESHIHEYGQIVLPYLGDYLTKLRTQNSVLDARQARRCFYILRHLIRRNNPDDIEDLRYLLSIPAVAALTHQAITPNQPNELLHLALMTNNQQASEALLRLDAVRQITQENSEEQREGLDLRALAQNCESSITALTPAEEKRLAAITQCYDATLQKTGVDKSIEGLKQYLLDRYIQCPAILVVNNHTLSLPASWEAFQALSLDKLAYNQAIAAYGQHKAHTAWRYLSKPNRWMHPQANYVKENLKGERWADFEGYKPLIALLWLAACDESAPPMEGWTLEGRIEHFITELALIGRAHNWDKSHVNARNQKQEYDDGELDRPSCYSGIKRRLFQAVKGHALATILTKEILQQELREFVCRHYDEVIAKDPSQKQTFLKSYEAYIMDRDSTALSQLAPLNISYEKAAAFLSALIDKYGEQFDKEYQLYIKNQLILDENPANAYHAIALDGLTQYWQNQYTQSLVVAPTGRKSSREEELDDGPPCKVQRVRQSPSSFFLPLKEEAEQKTKAGASHENSI